MEVNDALRLADKREDKLPNYPKRQQIWPDEDSAWLYERCGDLILTANEALGLALAGFIEPITILTYYEGDELTMHVDYSGWERVKLALVIGMNDPKCWTGGELEFLLPAERGLHPPRVLQKGEAIFYPGWVPHRVTPVTSGIRRTLIAFAYGPRYT